MIFKPINIAGVFLIELEPQRDERGFFSRTVCSEEFRCHGLRSDFIHQNISWNTFKGTLRGLHYQCAPWEEGKLIRVTQGAIWDVVVDLRSDSPTLGAWFGLELSCTNRLQIYIPEGIAHGFQTLLDNTEVFYEMTAPFNANACRGIIWNDPELAIEWPDPSAALIETRMSKRDRLWPRYKA